MVLLGPDQAGRRPLPRHQIPSDAEVLGRVGLEECPVEHAHEDRGDQPREDDQHRRTGVGPRETGFPHQTPPRNRV